MAQQRRVVAGSGADSRIVCPSWTVFQEAAAVGQLLLDAWCLRCHAVGQWRQVAATGTPIGDAKIVGSNIRFGNGDRLIGVHPETEGTTGEVYRGRDELGRPVALKLLKGTNERSRREARAVARLDHPNIVAA